jgi:hypothetical protein
VVLKKLLAQTTFDFYNEAVTDIESLREESLRLFKSGENANRLDEVNDKVLFFSY